MSSPVTYELRENIGIITVNNPPVNALSQAVRSGLSECLKEALNDSAAQAVIVTGGGSGIGKAIAKKFSKNRAIVCIADKNLDNAKLTSSECPNKSYPFYLDVTKKKGIQNLFQNINKTVGKYEILISNAGVSTMNYIDDLTEEDWDFNMNINEYLY